MKFFIVTVVAIGFLGGCSAKHNPNGSYERANTASEKAHERLK